MRKASGFSTIYMVVGMTTFCMFASLAVDYGHVQLTKSELRRAEDSATRAGAAGLAVDPTYALTVTQQFANKNYVDGGTLVLNTGSDVQIGTWNTSSHVFTKLSGNDQFSANAVRVFTRRNVANSFASVLGMRTCSVSGESISMIVSPVDVNQNVLATANPFLSGATPGTVASNVNPHNNPDYAGTANNPRQSPQAVSMSISDDEELTFDNIAGTAQHDPTLSSYQPDGQTGEDGGPADIGHNNLTTDGNNSYGSRMYNQNGIADVTAPINALVGVFLDDSDPKTSAAPANLDFSTAASRDFTELKPQLKQIFFIGDGLNSASVQQKFIAPKGATRLYLATWDFYEWNNNSGYRNVKVSRPMKIYTVK